MAHDPSAHRVSENISEDESLKKKIEQYMEMRAKNIRKCHFNYRRRR